MIILAALKIYDVRQQKTLILPCHRHPDAVYTLKALGYKENQDYIELKRGFVTDNQKFLDRITAYHEALNCDQLLQGEEEAFRRCCEYRGEIYALRHPLHSSQIW